MPGGVFEGHSDAARMRTTTILQTVTITSPVTQTVKVQLEAIMKVVEAASATGQRRCDVHKELARLTGPVQLSSAGDVHPDVWPLLKEAGITLEDTLGGGSKPMFNGSFYPALMKAAARSDAPLHLIW